MRRTKHIIILIITLLTGSTALRAQTYGNEWIDFTKTYYKFKVGKEGIYRIPKSSLSAAGIPDFITGNQFVLYKDGVEVPLYVTTPGAMGQGDFIEFYGRGPNGNFDKQLFTNQAWHINDSISLFSDTSCYYLTYGVNVYQRYTSVNNPVAGTPLQYVWYTAGKYFKNYQTSGRSYNSGDEAVYSPQFDCGEAWCNEYSPADAPAPVNIETPEVYSNGPNGSMRVNVTIKGVAGAQFDASVSLNNQNLNTETLVIAPVPAIVKRYNLTISPTQLQQSNTISYTSTYANGGDDEFATAQVEIYYPRTNNLNGLSEFRFNLKASPSANQYLQFTNFNHGGDAPRLYDITNKKVYVADISVNGQTRFYLDPSVTERALMMCTNSGTANLSSVKTLQFTDYSAASQQGNYVIITNDKLRTTGGGTDHIEKYKEYRSSPQGGGYNVIVADVETLYDQFSYGIDMHPLSIRKFLQYAYDTWNVRPEYAMLIGKGLRYPLYKAYRQNTGAYPFPIVPTYGDPGSDVTFVSFGNNILAKMKVGRLSAWNGTEVGNYLTKVKNYEIAMQDSPDPNLATEFWKKKFIHIAGGNDASLQGLLLTNLNNGKKIIEAPYFGAQVTTVTKNTTTPIDQIGSELVNAMIDSGVYALCFHGHGSAGSFDFNINNPEIYQNTSRLLHIFAYGCDISQIFNLTTIRTISERYINTTGGAISVLAQDNFGFPGFHGQYIQKHYRSLGLANYGATLGTQYVKAYDSMLYAQNLTTTPNEFTVMQLECLILMGDPAIKMTGFEKPDYHVTDDGLSTTPSNVTTTVDSFALNISTFNLGRAISDTVNLKVQHVNPQGVTTTLGVYSIVNLYSTKQLTVNVPINKTTDVGLNRYNLSIDDDQQFDEKSENNNTASISIFIFADKLVPVYPQEFAIVGTQDITLKASTLNPFKAVGNYKMQIDTTELFNSPALMETNVQSTGGVIKWKPNMSYANERVYYWRTAVDSGNSTQPQWTNSSFAYIPQKWGWNQSHYFQYLKDNFSTLNVLPSTRKFDFKQKNNLYGIFNACLDNNGNGNPNTVNDVKIMLNDVDIQRSGCLPMTGTLQIMVLDTITGEPWVNPQWGQQGSYPRCQTTRNTYVFEFPVAGMEERKKPSKFLDSIPNGHIIIIKNMLIDPFFNDYNGFAQHWATDNTSTKLYNTLKNLGFSQLDSFNKRRAFIFVCKKGDPSYPVTQVFSEGTMDKIQVDLVVAAKNDSGILFSTVVGPAKQWENLKWKTSTPDNQPQDDSVFVRAIGIMNNNSETVLFNTTNLDTSIAGINATTYPNMRLEWYSKDQTRHTSRHLDHWRVHYEPVPEAALNPNVLLSFKDTLGEGEQANLNLAIEELAGRPMDSMLVKYRVIDANGVAHDLQNVKYKELQGNDTLHAHLSFDPSAYPGDNFLFIEANPNNDQPEQFHPNNLGYLPFRVITDNLNPIIDVTFDGIHILDKDIVSSKPFIKIMLKDENKYMKLDDTSLLNVSIRYIDDGSGATPVPLDGTTAKFIPAASTEKNEAYVEYRPEFLQDGFYELSVNGEDKKGNKPSATDYRISFEVINKSTITNVLNYPNPFSTSTAFLFTLTGWQLPSQFKIQILTVTGKVVREITKQELGPMHIGRNISEYKWDGKDQYGQMLGNGVYLYRVVTTIAGQDIEHRKSEADKFTQKGYGKMYIMR